MYGNNGKASTTLAPAENSTLICTEWVVYVCTDTHTYSLVVKFFLFHSLPLEVVGQAEIVAVTGKIVPFVHIHTRVFVGHNLLIIIIITDTVYTVSYT